MQRIRDYVGFIVLFVGLGYLAGWAAAPDSLSEMPAGLHALGLGAFAFLPWRAWVYWQARKGGEASGSEKSTPAVPYLSPLPPPRRPTVKPRSHFGLRGMPPSPR